MAKLKAEYLQHYYDRNRIPLRTRMIAHISRIHSLGSLFPGLFNFVVSSRPISSILKRMIGFARERSIPRLGRKTVRQWARKHLKTLNNQSDDKGSVLLFLDEFTNYTDTVVGIKTIRLLTALGYQVMIPDHTESGRTFLSKGLLRSARKMAIRNIEYLSDQVSADIPIIGIEPSAILAFRDEYPDLVRGDLKVKALELAKHALLLEEFLLREIRKGNIGKEQFSGAPKHIKLHGHCQQKSIASTEPLKQVLSLPEHFTVEEIPSGCCGMAGSFGYEKEHYELSMRVGELILFPSVRDAAPETIVVAPGTSCRHQIKDGTGVNAFHPAELLFDALV